MAYELEKVYSPKDAEDRIYANWVEKGYFRAEVDPNKKPFTIMMPPPNITGQLHMGHAMDLTLQDILTRVKRMQGYSALWLPGTDHAALATEVKIVEAMKAEGVTKADLGREGFLERAWKWKEQYGGRIVQQAKKMGSSCDWSRERFTMDEGCSEAVKKVFVNLYNKGLIYRGERIINWCPTCKTSLSDIEVEFSESEGNFWHLRYPLTDGSGELILATTRPETMLGDTAVAVHPDDERYKHLIGKTVTLPLVNREIPIVGDEYVEKDFGTGVVKITPAHDPNDFEVGQRHDLPIINVMNLDGSINDEFGGKYAGLDRYDARKAIVKDLEEGGYLVKIEPLSHNVGSCYRCNTVIEPMLSKQWFVKMQPLAEPAIKVVEDELTEFVPERFQKVYFNWMNNIRDWCISRQIWWGHRIPAFYCDECGELIVSADHVETCPKCGAMMRQDEDTLDTWFSSALWPFSTLGWPEKTEDLEYFYPTSVLVTGYDIIFFWVARMIFSGLEHTGETPFKHVYIHGLVRDSQGRKMSKSLGNGIDPLEIIDQYGADALRFTLVNGNSPGNDMRYSDEKVKASRNFANKLWNAARFILMNDVEDVVPDTLPEALALEDRWVLSQLNNVVKEVCANIDRYELGIAAAKISDFAWDVFCDWYIEIAKMRLNGDDEQSKAACKQVLICVFTAILKMLHPFMPFVTEEIYCNIPHSCESIMISSYPEYDEKLNFPEDELAFEEIMQLIKQVRVARSEMNVPPSKRTKLYIETKHTEIFESGVSYIKRLASADHVEIGDSFDVPGAVQIVAATARGLIPMEDLVDKEKELARLGREKATCEKEIASLEGRLSNEQFTGKAPAKVVEGERAKLQAAKEKLALIEQSIAALN